MSNLPRKATALKSVAHAAPHNLTHVHCERRYAKDERDSAYSLNFLNILIWNWDSLAFIYPEVVDSVIFLMKRILVFQHEEISKSGINPEGTLL